MQDTVQTIPAAFTGIAPAVEPRTITYPLKTGGSLTVTCPDWCVYDHTDDVARGIDPDSLFHQGDKVGLEYAADGVDLSVFEARLAQWPFDPEDSSPYIEFIPEGSTAVSQQLADPIAVGDEIRKVRAHLRALEELAGQLAQAKADDHARNTRGDLAPWTSLSRADLASLPIAYLLRVFGVTVQESAEIGAKVSVVLGGEPGSMLLLVHPSVPQDGREDETRRALLAWHTALTEGDSDADMDEALRRVRKGRPA